MGPTFKLSHRYKGVLGVNICRGRTLKISSDETIKYLTYRPEMARLIASMGAFPKVLDKGFPQQQKKRLGRRVLGLS